MEGTRRQRWEGAATPPYNCEKLMLEIFATVISVAPIDREAIEDMARRLRHCLEEECGGGQPSVAEIRLRDVKVADQHLQALVVGEVRTKDEAYRAADAIEACLEGTPMGTVIQCIGPQGRLFDRMVLPKGRA